LLKILPFDFLRVNPSTPRPEGLGLLRVDPEQRHSTKLMALSLSKGHLYPALKAGFGAAEWVNLLFLDNDCFFIQY
jgi:hypothetical protein